ncbi:MAG: hypothetical protein MK212_02615 [Saprospiraceae bacterium]|nr:hypothetical protein [Saprospiraceae bacterium]
MTKILCFLSICLCFQYSSYAQEISEENQDEQLVAYEWEMRELLNIVLNDKDRKNREEASTKLETTLEKAFQEDGAFEYKFKQVQGLSIITPSDQAFRIFTWQLYMTKDTYQYCGYIQMPDKKFYRLDDKSADMYSPQFSRLKPSKWYGALYYNIKPFKAADGSTKYLLFGYDVYDFFTRRKVLDVLHFYKGAPRFGDKVIEMKDGRGMIKTVSRFILQYSASVSATMNYADDKDMVIYDHLIYQMIPGQGPSNVPDGSYTGLELKKGKWMLVEKVYKHDPYFGNDNPPLEHAILGKNKSRDIIGRTKKKHKVKNVSP